jgi:hypothetical protein
MHRPLFWKSGEEVLDLIADCSLGEAVGLDALVRQHARSLLRVTVSKEGRKPDPARRRPSRWRAIAHV